MSNGTTNYYTEYSSPAEALASFNHSSGASVPFEFSPSWVLFLVIGFWGSKVLGGKHQELIQ